VVPPRAQREKLADSAVFIYGLGLLNREGLRATGIDPSRQVLLGFVARHDGPDVTGPPREVVLDKSVNTRMLQHYILEGVRHVTYVGVVSSRL
jgi:hypothetical protein